MTGKHYWTEEEKEYLRKCYADTLTADIASVLDLRLSQVRNMAFQLGLKKSEAFKSQITKDLHKDPEFCRRKSEGLRGLPAWNKGMKGLRHPGSEKGWFKKGHEPHNTTYNGYKRVSKEGYVEVRVEKGKFVLLHRKIYEEHNGPIPPDCIVIFKDGNKRNFNINNLEMITRAENVLRNSWLRYPPEVRQLIGVKKVLTRVINNQKKAQ